MTVGRVAVVVVALVIFGYFVVTAGRAIDYELNRIDAHTCKIDGTC